MMNLLPLNAQIVKLSHVQSNLEKSITSVVERFKDYTEFDLNELAITLEEDRQQQCKVLQAKVKDIVEPLKSKMTLIRNKELVNVTDFKQFKKEMIFIQDNIQNLKYDSKKQIKLLENEFESLSEDILFYNEQLLKWMEPVQINIYAPNRQKPTSIRSKHQCKEAKEFLDFVHSSGGHANGWRDEDHRLFIKFRKKFNDADIMAKKLHDEFPDISVEDIKRHDEWYRKYLELEMKKRKALKSWQKDKANRTVTKYSNIPSKIAPILRPSENVQEKLMNWKAQKEEQRKTAEQIDIFNAQRKSETEQVRKKRNEELKMIVMEWKQKKQSEEEQETAEKKIAEEQEKKRRAMEANKLIKRFQSQDDIFILKMKHKRKPDPCPVIRSKSSYLAKRDPNRLLKPTQQWINRVHGEDLSNKFGKVMPLTRLPKLAIPEWRRKLDS